MRDNGLSPLYYTGNHGLLNISYQSRTDSRTSNLEIEFLIGDITPSNYPELSLSEIRNNKTAIRYSYQRLAPNVMEHGKLFLGGKWETQFAYYIHNQFENSSMNNFFINTLNLSGSLSYPLKTNEQKYLMIFQADLPIVAFIVRPSYAYIKPKGFLDHSQPDIQKLMNSIEVSSFDRFSGMSTGVSFEYRLKNNHSLRIGYNWEYWNHQNSNPLKSATHGIMLQTMFNL